MNRVYWAERSGTRYLVVDYSGATAAQMLDILDEAVLVIAAEPGPFPLLTDVTGAATTADWLSAIKRASGEVMGPKVSRCAVLGITGIKAAMLRGFNTVGGGLRALPFRDAEQAVAYLLKG